jgi:hypothetical protein
MLYRDEIAGIVEPKLKEIFDRLNLEVFGGRLTMPDSLAYDYRRVGSRRNKGRGGQINYSNNTGHCYYIVVRGKQKGNTKFEELTMLHEMVHLSLVQQFFATELQFDNYRVKDFVADKSGTFILECAKVATIYGCTFDELYTWDSQNNPDQETTLTSKKYSEVQAAKSLLASLS